MSHSPWWWSRTITTTMHRSHFRHCCENLSTPHSRRKRDAPINLHTRHPLVGSAARPCPLTTGRLPPWRYTMRLAAWCVDLARHYAARHKAACHVCRPYREGPGAPQAIGVAWRAWSARRFYRRSSVGAQASGLSPVPRSPRSICNPRVSGIDYDL